MVFSILSRKKNSQLKLLKGKLQIIGTCSFLWIQICLKYIYMSNLFRRIILSCTINAPKKLYALYFTDCELLCKCSNWTMTFSIQCIQTLMRPRLEDWQTEDTPKQKHGMQPTGLSLWRLKKPRLHRSHLTPSTFSWKIRYKMFKNCNSIIGICRSCINICVMGENQ